MSVHQQYLNNYFGKIWAKRDRGLDQYGPSGYALAEYVQPGNRVIDVGCGKNPFRGFIPNCVGVDPAFDEADYKMTIEEFAYAHRIHKFDIALCLGSINFGTEADILAQIKIVVGLLKTQDTKIFWRCNPGTYDHGNPEFNLIPIYPWTFDDHARFAAMFDFSVIDTATEANGRLYAVWQNNKTGRMFN